MESGKDSARSRLPLSLEDLRKKRDQSAAEQSKLLFVPRALRAAPADEGKPGAHREASEVGTTRSAFPSPSASRPAPPDERGTRAAPGNAQRPGPDRGRVDKRKGERQSRNQERSRFKFDWDAADDTTAEAADPLYAELRAKSFGAPGFKEASKGGTFGARSKRATQPGGRGFEKEPQSALLGARSSEHLGLHWSKKDRDAMTVRDWAIFREDHAISLRGPTGNSVKPARNWKETGLPAQLLELVRKVGYTTPSPVQMCAVPIVLTGKDIIGLAETGSGKTAAFVLPMLTHIRKMPKMTEEIAGDGPYALIMAPTRELVLQIEAETRKFATPLGYRVVAVIGGQGLEEQGLALQSGCEVVVCTPGRMMDLLSRQLAVLSNCNYVILDEADRMIDMGFEPQVQEILSALPPPPGAEQKGTSGEEHRQTVMFSATMSPSVERLAKEYLRQPIIVTIGETGKAADAVDQRVEFLSSEGKKRDRLKSLVRELEPPVIVFANTKKGCEDVARLIDSGSGARPLVLHSGKSQEQREQIFDAFKTGRAGILVATDLLGRGIDIKGVNHVINFELPTEMSKYTHRIGRTGRAGRKGIAWSLTTAADSDIFGALHAYLEQSGARVCREIARHSSSRGNRGHIID